ncbi:hypothetical protein [Phenylobacterium deserti]|uniref:Uncharacterized protein n=1 Tax=Phenylobacterium deserti TaxID=1914756 RepID=A0A328AC96_9CAUL|nr:hypothetical protein [Phenylobacterium deserti]RAK52249.1 hypothetical protein DJ018_13965 [Phenylobacterium deserti]
MAEVDFERRLERMFQDIPAFPDAGEFAERIERRLDRGWATRRWLIGAAGVVGGVLGASQLIMSNVFQRVESAEGSARLLSSSLSQVAPQASLIPDLSAGSGIVWAAMGVAIVMMGFVLTRVIEEI